MKFISRKEKGDFPKSSAKNLDYKKYLAEIFLAAGIILLVSLIPLVSKAYATEEFWDLNIGNDTVAVLSSKEDAKKAIDKVESYYTKDGAKDVKVTLEPQMSTKQEFYPADKTPEVTSVDKAVKLIIDGKEKTEEYTVQENDTLWAIAESSNLSVEELTGLNADKDLTVIKPGDKLKVSVNKPLVNVTTVQTVTGAEEIAYETTYEDSADLASGTTEVKTAGEVGSQNVTKTVTMINGKVTASEVLSSEVTKAPVTQVVLKGTKVAAVTSGAKKSTSNSVRSSHSSDSSSQGGGSYSGSGSEVMNYALQFVGNPYVYGGTSLTSGADCSGFVMSVYSHFGVSLPRGANAQGRAGYGVSYGDAQPGDIVYFSKGHTGIYLGNGMMVHASEPRTGIIVTRLSYSGTPASFRRVI